MTAYTDGECTHSDASATTNTYGRREGQEYTNRLGSPEALAKAKAGKAAAKWARINSTLRTNFLDASHWTELASFYHLRLPPWGTPCTTGAMTRWLKRTRFSVAWYREWSGYQSLQEWIDANPLWPLRAFAGLCLEERELTDYRGSRS